MNELVPTVTGESIASTGSGLEACAASDKDASRSVFRLRPTSIALAWRRAPHVPTCHVRLCVAAVQLTLSRVPSIYSDTPVLSEPSPSHTQLFIRTWSVACGVRGRGLSRVLAVGFT